MEHNTGAIIAEGFIFLSNVVGFITVIVKNRKKIDHTKEEITKKVDERFNRHEASVGEQLTENKAIAMQAAKNAAYATQAFSNKMDRLTAMFDALRAKEAELQQMEMGRNIQNALTLAEEKATENAEKDSGRS